MDFALESKKRNLTPAGATGRAASAFEQRKMTEAQKKAQAADAAANAHLAEMKLFDVSMKLTGIAPNDVAVAQFIRKLTVSRLLKDVNLVITDEFIQDGEPMRKFVIECMLDPTAEVQPGENHNNKTAATEIKAVK